jgi:hypothetical protein
MTSDFRTDLHIEHLLNHLIDQIIEINAQSVQIIQAEQKRDVDLYYVKSDDFKRSIQVNES